MARYSCGTLTVNDAEMRMIPSTSNQPLTTDVGQIWKVCYHDSQRIFWQLFQRVSPTRIISHHLYWSRS